MIDITLTTMQGTTRKIKVKNKQHALEFIELYKVALHPGQRVKITCDLLGISGYLQGERTD